MEVGDTPEPAGHVGAQRVNDRLQPSRRDFLAASTLGILGLVSTKPTPPNGEAQPDGELLYVGTYTEGDRAEGIHLVRMDSRSGELRRVRAVRAGANPSFLALHPNGRVLYAVNEVTELDGKATGAVSAFAITADTGDLTLLNTQHSHGGAPCYVSVDRRGRIVLVANYLGGSIASLPIQSSGALGVATQVVQHQGRGLNAERQEAPHAHCVIADRSNRFALVADLGIDRVLVYRLADDGTLRRTGGDAILHGGAGPRHIALHPTQPLVFVANELDSTVAVLHFDAERGGLLTTQTLSALPAGWKGTSFAADIHLDPSGRALYVSNRGHNSIAMFSVADATGMLALEQTISTGGDWPRNFSIDPTGRWLLVANQRSGSIVVFARDQQSGRLTPTPHRLEVASPVCLRFSR